MLNTTVAMVLSTGLGINSSADMFNKYTNMDFDS